MTGVGMPEQMGQQEDGAKLREWWLCPECSTTWGMGALWQDDRRAHMRPAPDDGWCSGVPVRVREVRDA